MKLITQFIVALALFSEETECYRGAFNSQLRMMIERTGGGVPQTESSQYKAKLSVDYAKLVAVSVSIFPTMTKPTIAKTFFDTDVRKSSVRLYCVTKLINSKFYRQVYGDKELKIATVNKLKQKLRNAILQDISIAPDFVKLAVNDALGFNVQSEGNLNLTFDN
jgi:hypothetical protein